jgi:hypothetical protein
MPGEKRGRILEALTIATLESRLKLHRLDYLWDESRDDLAVKPDLLVLDREKAPMMLALVTWGGSRTNVKEKFWRDIGELVDARLAHPALRVMSIRATKQFSGKEMSALSLLMDANVAISTFPRAKPLVAEIEAIADANRTILGKDKALEVGRQLKRKHGDVAGSLLAECEPLLSGQAAEAKEVKAAKTRLSSLSFCSSRKTSVKIAVAQLLVLDAQASSDVISGRPLPRSGATALAKQCGACTREVTPKTSPEITESVALLGGDTLRKLVELDRADCAKHLRKLREVAAIDLDSVADELAVYGSARAIQQRLRDSENRAAFAIGLRTLVSLRYGKQGSGLLDRMAETTGQLRPQLHGITLPALEAGSSIPTKVEAGIAKAYSEKLSNLTKKEVQAFASKLDEVVRYQFRNALMSHGVDPLRNLIMKQAKLDGLPAAEVRAPSWVGKRTEAELGVRFSNNDLSTRGVRIKGSFIHWKSAYDGNEGHKTKELAGRVFAIRPWLDRSHSGRFLLVLDGHFSTENIKTLMRAGWDDIFYPDEIDRLVKAVV